MVNDKTGDDRIAERSILVVDDEENMRHMLQVLLTKQGYRVELAANGMEALQMAQRQIFTFILCDIKMPVMEGTDFLNQAAQSGITSTIIMMSAFGTHETAIECMKLGAYDYISKPFNHDEILLVFRKAEERERLKAENRRLREEVNREYSLGSIISKNQRMMEIFNLVRRVSEFKTTVLILGESGTGKELIARAIHTCSQRRNAPFVAVNCGAIPENLLESELFGHVKGAFTDASSAKAGLFEQADGGTLFLDEIGEMPLSLQVKLLRVLEGEEIRRVGANSSRKINIRVLSATSKDLAGEAAAGRFREDLYFRLNVFSVTLPPLRERMEDLPLLVEHFLQKFGDKLEKPGLVCSQEVMRALLDYPWPGNVRELENCLERAVVLCDGEQVKLDCLPDALRSRSSKTPPSMLQLDTYSIKIAEERLERDLIQRALKKTNGNRTHAARLLEISHRALLYKLKDYGLE